MSHVLPKQRAKRIWIHAQKLDEREPFGRGPTAVQKAIEHLGYVQIDTIHVIERSHHHILFNRIPRYHRNDLHQAQTHDKSVFEYWTHALSYVPARDFRFFVSDMKQFREQPNPWYGKVKPEEFRKVLRLIQKEGALSIRDIDDDVLVDKDHPWASRKPSKKALQFGFYGGRFVVSERVGMIKKYELTERHFGWKRFPRGATEKEVNVYLLDRALRSQGLVSLDSICHLDASRKPAMKKLIEGWKKKNELIEVEVEGMTKGQHWIRPEAFEENLSSELNLIHLLSPFDPLVIQRKRLQGFFDYEHRFEAYVPKEKRVFGYFALPVLAGDQIVAAIDLKTDRDKKKLLIQQWTWIKKHQSTALKKQIEEELHRFERFQIS